MEEAQEYDYVTVRAQNGSGQRKNSEMVQSQPLAIPAVALNAFTIGIDVRGALEAISRSDFASTDQFPRHRGTAGQGRAKAWLAAAHALQGGEDAWRQPISSAGTAGKNSCASVVSAKTSRYLMKIGLKDAVEFDELGPQVDESLGRPDHDGHALPIKPIGRRPA
jgi:hypothetical protein